MKKSAQSSAPEPAHDFDLSQAVEAYRHEATGRTVGRIQPAGNDVDSHLFSATGLFIATVKTSTITAKLPKSVKRPAPAAEPTGNVPSAPSA
jgi:hypothetical protein